MSSNYDNWERLVAAVIKREQVWELCHANSRDTSFSSSVSSYFNSQFQQDFESARSAVQELSTDPQIEFQWIEQYERGVYLWLGYSSDEMTEIRKVRFSRRRFNETAAEAETWWLNNRDKVYLRFVGKPRTDWAPFLDTSDNVELMLETPVSLGTRSTFSTNMKPTDSLVDTRANIQKLIEWFQYYEPDVCVILRAHRADRDGTTYVARVSFSGRNFEARQAEAWWLMNREKVCEKYGARAGLAQIKQSSLSVRHPASLNGEVVTPAKSK